MKKLAVLLLCLLLCGCGSRTDSLDVGIELRRRLVNGAGCSMDVTVTADYGDQTYTIAMGCEFDAHGNLSFAVQQPQTIAGISGNITDAGGNLTFDNIALAFPLLADGQLSPVSAPWILMKTLRGGYITSAGEVEGGILLILDDSYADDAMTVHVQLGADGMPSFGEIYYKGRRILTVEVKKCRIL